MPRRGVGKGESRGGVQQYPTLPRHFRCPHNLGEQVAHCESHVYHDLLLKSALKQDRGFQYASHKMGEEVIPSETLSEASMAFSLDIPAPSIFPVNTLILAVQPLASFRNSPPLSSPPQPSTPRSSAPPSQQISSKGPGRCAAPRSRVSKPCSPSWHHDK